MKKIKKDVFKPALILSAATFTTVAFSASVDQDQFFLFEIDRSNLWHISPSSLPWQAMMFLNPVEGVSKNIKYIRIYGEECENFQFPTESVSGT